MAVVDGKDEILGCRMLLVIGGRRPSDGWLDVVSRDMAKTMPAVKVRAIHR